MWKEYKITKKEIFESWKKVEESSQESALGAILAALYIIIRILANKLPDE